MISTGLKFAQTWAPAVLRLPWQAPPGITLAVLAAAAAHFGWLAGPLELSRPAEVTLGIVMVATILWVTEAVPLFVTSLLVLALELTWLAPTLAVDRNNPGLFLNAFFSDVTLLFLGGGSCSARASSARAWTVGSRGSSSNGPEGAPSPFSSPSWERRPCSPCG